MADAGKTPAIGSTQTINTALTTAPLFFVRSGYVSLDSTLGYPGYVAYYWSRSSISSSDAFSLNFNSSGVYPSNYYSRYRGFSLRCLYHHVK